MSDFLLTLAQNPVPFARPCCADNCDVRYAGDVAMCTVCWTWHDIEGPMTPEQAAAYARAPMPLDEICEAFDRAAAGMLPDTYV